jgi:hypothetical protein
MKYHYSIKTGISQIKTKFDLTKSLLGFVALAFPGVLALSTLGASAASTYTLSPWVYDPGNACPGITSQWDNTTGNPPPSLHLTKPCLTATNASSGATVNGVEGITLTELNFDYRNDGHCGAGAPRYNVVTSDNVTHFFGCASATKTPTSDPNWTNASWDPTNPAQAFPVIAPGTTVQSIDIVFDEGTDQGVAYAYLDNFSINNQEIGSPNTPASKDACKKDGWKTLQDGSGKSFKNQGDCVSFVATGGKNKANG